MPPMQLSEILRFDTPTGRLRGTAFLEGLSYVLLLFVAMPLKYAADMPLAVTVVGTAHGFLFVALFIMALEAMREREKSFGWGVKLAVASLVPFGTFFLDRSLGDDDEAFRRDL